MIHEYPELITLYPVFTILQYWGIITTYLSSALARNQCQTEYTGKTLLWNLVYPLLCHKLPSVILPSISLLNQNILIIGEETPLLIRKFIIMRMFG